MSCGKDRHSMQEYSNSHNEEHGADNHSNNPIVCQDHGNANQETCREEAILPREFINVTT